MILILNLLCLKEIFPFKASHKIFFFFSKRKKNSICSPFYLYFIAVVTDLNFIIAIPKS